MNVDEVLSNCGTVSENAWYGGKTQMVFEDTSGAHQIALVGVTLETGWESYTAATRIYADGNGVYVPDDENVGSYHNVSVQRGECKSIDAMTEYMQKNFGDLDFHEVDSKPFFTRAEYETAMADKQPVSNGITMDKQAFSDLMQELPTNVFTGGGKTDRSFVSEDGHQIDISGYPVESSYEFFEGGVSIREGKVGEKSSLLYREDATCIGPYNFKSFHEGRFNSPDEVAEYLADKYKDQKFTETKKMLQPNYSEEHKVVWDDKKYASELARQEKFQSYSRYGEDDLKRLVWQDKGDVRMSNGQAGHMVTFAYACDQMKPGKDEIVPNPYLKTFKAKDGSVNHAMILPDDLYNRLKDVSGPGGGPWQGSFVSVLETKSMGKRTSVFPDLSNMALEAGVLKAPDEPFDLKKHDQFVKFSVKERAAARELPKVPEASVSQESQFEV